MLLKGALARCSLGHLGLITSEKPEEVKYPDGNVGIAWTGFHVWPFKLFGTPWSSRNPQVICHINENGKVLYLQP